MSRILDGVFLADSIHLNGAFRAIAPWNDETATLVVVGRDGKDTGVRLSRSDAIALSEYIRDAYEGNGWKQRPLL